MATTYEGAPQLDLWLCGAMREVHCRRSELEEGLVFCEVQLGCGKVSAWRWWSTILPWEWRLKDGWEAVAEDNNADFGLTGFP